MSRVQRGSEAGDLRAAVGVMDRVGVAQHLRAVAVVVLQHDVRDDVGLARRPVLNVFIGPFAGQGDDFGMQHLLALAELLDELLDAVLIVKRLPFRARHSFVEKSDFQIRIQERQLAQPLRNPLRLEFRRLLEYFRIRLERDQSPRAF